MWLSHALHFDPADLASHHGMVDLAMLVLGAVEAETTLDLGRQVAVRPPRSPCAGCCAVDLSEACYLDPVAEGCCFGYGYR